MLFRSTLNGANLGVLSLPATGAWTTWEKASVAIQLKSGKNNLTLTSTMAEGGPNIDIFGFSVAGVTLASGTESVNRIIYAVDSYQPQTGLLKVSSNGRVKVEAFDMLGNQVSSYVKDVSAGENYVSVATEPLAKGVYWVQVHFNNKVLSRSKLAVMQ